MNQQSNQNNSNTNPIIDQSNIDALKLDKTDSALQAKINTFEQATFPQNNLNKLGQADNKTCNQDLQPKNAQEVAFLAIAKQLTEINTYFKSARRWRMIKQIIFGLFILLAASSVINTIRNETIHIANDTQSHTAIIHLNGEIAAGMPTSAEYIKKALNNAYENNAVKGVILKINSPGGSPVQSGLIYDEIMRLRKAYPKKPIYAVVEEMCASGAYYIASATTSIYVDKASVVGSIGVLMDGFGFDKTMQKLGVERRLYTAGSNKGMLDPFSPENPQHKAIITETLNEIHQQFIDAVKQGRGNKLKNDPSLFTGQFWTGQKSIQLGLTDQIGHVEMVAKDIIKEKDLIDYTIQEDFADRLVKRFGAMGTQIGQSMGKHMGEALINAGQSTPTLK